MLLPRIQAPVRAALNATRATTTMPAARGNVLEALRSSTSGFALSSSPNLTFVRHASHQTQGRANGVKNGPGKRLGAKKTGEQYVVPGNIIFRQRGTLWFPGENCGMGRDHTIHATQPGYVKYYRDPRLHPKRRYIGVVFNRNDTLPTPPHAARRRRLGMLAVPRSTLPERDSFAVGDALGDSDNGIMPDLGLSGEKKTSVTDVPKGKRSRIPPRNLTLRPGYMYREANWEIGRAAERAGVKVREFVPGDRFRAWKKRIVGKRRGAIKRSMATKKGGKGGKKGKK